MIDQPVSRRVLIQKVGLATGGLALGFQLGDAVKGPAYASDSTFAPNAWLRIESSGALIFILDKAEMGQGVHTALPTILAEELYVDPTRFTIESATWGPAYTNPKLVNLQMTGGSTSIASCYEPLRKAGATARAMLMAAAAKEWQVSVEECLTPGDGTVFHPASKKRMSYAELATLAGKQPVPDNVSLKDPKEFVFIGKKQSRLDGLIKVTGKATFGIDVTLPDLRAAVLLLCPVLGGKPKTFDASKALAMSGVEDVVMTSRGVAVVAKKYWQARAAAAHVKVDWDAGELANTSTDQVFATLHRLTNDKMLELSESRDARGLLTSEQATLTAEYEAPYLAHAAMEPTNCTARVTPNACDVWAPTQSVALARQVAHEASGIPLEFVNIHTTFLGGGFGRRLYQDYIRDAVEIAKAVKKPVKLIWSREDDMRHDYYRPGSAHSLRAKIDAKGQPLAWGQVIASQSILAQALPEWMPAMIPDWVPNSIKGGVGAMTGGIFRSLGQDDTAVEGAKGMAYAIETKLIEYQPYKSTIPVGFWRSVGHSYNGFVVESFIDEMAHAAKQDPLLFRQQLLKEHPRHLATLELVAKHANWGQAMPAGGGRGIAVHESFGSVCAQVVEVFVGPDKSIQVRRVTAAIHCGRAINPGHVEAQIMSSIVYGLSAALSQQIKINQGQVEQGNFDDYPVTRFTDTPIIDVYIVPSEAEPTGVGEPGVPPLAAALGNAIFAATGTRLRKLPLTLS